MLEFNENNELTKKFDTVLSKAMLYALLWLLLIGINKAYVFEFSLTPFGIAIVFALLFVGINGYVLSGIFVLSYIMSNVSLAGVIESVNVVFVLTIIQVLISKKKISNKKWIMFVALIFSMIAYVVFSYGCARDNLALVISIILAEIFLYMCMCFWGGLKTVGQINALNIDEKVCGAIVLLLFFIGISRVYIYTLNLGIMISAIIILILVYVLDNKQLLVVSCIIGLGFGVSLGDYIYVSLFIILSLMVMPFKSSYKILGTISLNLGYLIFMLIDNSFYNLWNVLSLMMGSLVFLMISRNLRKISALFLTVDNYAFRDMYDRKVWLLSNRVTKLSEVFLEMCNVYKDMVKGSLSAKDVGLVVKESLKDDVCKKCTNYNHCFRSCGDLMDNAINQLIEVGVDKGKVVLIDVPQFISFNCSNISGIILDINSLLESYNKYAKAVDNLDSSRLLIADQLDGVSKLLKTMSNDLDCGDKYDDTMCLVVKENLSYSGVVCYECFVLDCGTNVKYISIIVNNNNINDKNIEDVISKIFKHKYVILAKRVSSYPNSLNIILVTAPNFDIAFGSSTTLKFGSAISGDSHSVIEIDNGKYMLSICDGMGSGNRASKISSLTLKLIEYFYKAGFDNDVILSSVNKLLSLDDSEHFSSIDACIIDGRNNCCDFIKLGATNGYILHADRRIETIVASGLPVGVIDNIRPHTVKRNINALDMIILLSDGVSDVLGADIENYIRAIDNINPQSFCDKLMNIAIELSGGVASDDMTIVCARIIENL